MSLSTEKLSFRYEKKFGKMLEQNNSAHKKYGAKWTIRQCKDRWPRGKGVNLVTRRSGVQPLRSAHLGMCLETCSPGRPKPCEELWVDDRIIEKCLRSETWRLLAYIGMVVAQAP